MSSLVAGPLAVATFLTIELVYVAAVLILPGQVKDCHGGPFLGVVASLALVLGVGLGLALAPSVRDRSL